MAKSKGGSGKKAAAGKKGGGAHTQHNAATEKADGARKATEQPAIRSGGGGKGRQSDSTAQTTGGRAAADDDDEGAGRRVIGAEDADVEHERATRAAAKDREDVKDAGSGVSRGKLFAARPGRVSLQKTADGPVIEGATFDAAATVKITVNDKPAGWDDLKRSDDVTLTGDPVKHIDARR